jgi:hypothetical protein
MGINTKDFALLLITAILAILALFCYDVGNSANCIKPGIGDGMLTISMASGILTILTGVNLTIMQKKRRRKLWDLLRGT